MTTTNNLGIYIHVPFCIRKCPYCGFYSMPIGRGEEDENGRYTISDIQVYKDKIIRDIKGFGAIYSLGRKVNSIFFGGGTPTVLKGEDLTEILSQIYLSFDVLTDCEITLEANPGSQMDETKLRELLRAGFNRISIGVQSFNDNVLSTLGRIHNSAEAEAAFKAARQAGFENINLDLMFGIPGQTMKQWEDTLRKTISLNPEHISFYSLQLEEGTPYFKLFEEGKITELSDDLDRAMYHGAINMLKSAGYKHYEISNASKPGFECRHNLKYWTLEEYLGIGPSASSYIDGKRFTFDYSGEGYSENHQNSNFDNMSEYTFTGLRLTGGIDYGSFKSKFGADFREVFSDRWKELEEFFTAGFLKEYVSIEGIPMGLRITEKGLDVSNKIMSVFV
ncbi:MAG: radical SAM family heme chaperone HemW [Firmicutes bacterium]|nr:radical SAM family heme chaperone HemW [Bacillota bacterium]